MLDTHLMDVFGTSFTSTRTGPLCTWLIFISTKANPTLFNSTTQNETENNAHNQLVDNIDVRQYFKLPVTVAI